MHREHRAVVVIPTYNNPETIEDVARRARQHLPVVVVNDGSTDPAMEAALGRLHGVAFVVQRQANGGKGAAVKDGLRWAHAQGFSHAIQVDADGQHNLEDIPALLHASRQHPDALVLARPEYDDSAPAVRRVARHISIFWVRVATLLDRGTIDDPMCGFRVYPLASTVDVLWPTGDRMDFDPEIAVRLVWRGLSVVNVPTRVRYMSEEEGGVSHYRAFRDNVLVSIMHARLCIVRYLGFWRSM